ncbi:DNA polymerase IV [Mumia sp. zg.B53]|uniref:DNA polymerase IV n=1 Tax=Mumia sp. zg.B53 TaxID=2855449 RepID=UPI001C6EBF9E|nr:DNA polymerase IV [Mumia sp. zg.B53]MBW9213398.1 DNA polymerase IV [Mumia sp. zg.B53]
MWVLHVDLDQFIAAVEVLRRPELAGKPVVVGGRGDPSERGVVSTASYEAREYGVRSGMPLRTAAKKCPDAVFLPVDKPAYDAASAEVMDALRSVGTAVEILGWDEAFVAVPDAVQDADGAVAFARQVQSRVLERTRLHCSVGIGDNKIRAKNATDFGKPRGTFVLTRDTWWAVMGERPADGVWGIGGKTAAKLAALGLSTVREVGDADEDVLAAALGPTMGPWYRRLARGVDTSPVDPTPWVPRSHGHEVTFQTDLRDPDEVEAEVRRLAALAARDVVEDGRPAVRVRLKIRYVPFETRTRSTTLAGPTSDAAVIADAAASLLERTDRTRAVRLVGVAAEMAPPGDHD